MSIGEAVSKALGDRAGIQRYGSAMIPMDETLTRVSLDASNRPYLVWKVNFSRPKLGEMDTELFKEWFQAFAQSAGVTLHVENLYGENNHHIVESCFKGLARALRQAVEIDPRRAGAVPSTKGTLSGSLQMLTAIIDYGSGNLRSAAKAFERAGGDIDGAEDVVVTSRPEDVRGADRIVLPGVGRLCRLPARARRGARAGGGAVVEAVIARGRPFLGICVGMQLMAERGREFETVAGLGWIGGEVVAIEPADPSFKIPHMGWNELDLHRDASGVRRRRRRHPRLFRPQLSLRRRRHGAICWRPPIMAGR